MKKFYILTIIFVGFILFTAQLSIPYHQKKIYKTKPNNKNNVSDILSDSVLQEWTARYNGIGNLNEFGQAIAVDDSNNIIVTGYNTNSIFVIKYDELGATKWVNHYDGIECSVSNLAIDNLGNIIITGTVKDSGSYLDYLTIKYNSNGSQEWVQIFNGSGNGDDKAADIVTDLWDNVYVTGSSAGGNTSNDYATVKYSSNGTMLWVALFNGASNNGDYASALATDDSGNVYVTGSSTLSSTSYESITIKYDSSGTELWIVPTEYSAANDIAVSKTGNVYITGWSYLYNAFSCYMTSKINSNGQSKWTAYYQGPRNYIDKANAITIDSMDNVYVTGFSYAVNTNADYATVKYNSNGSRQWVERYTGTWEWRR